MKSLTICLILASSFAISTANPSLASQDSRFALVIGNSDYASSPLRNPVNDATDISGVLRELGFTVTLETNASARAMKTSIREFGQRLRKGGVGLFYYAGHGLQVRGRNYLVPVGADIGSEADVEFEAVDAGRVLAQMEEAGNDLNIIILDACRDNPFARSFRSGSRGLAKMDAPTGSILAYSTAPGRTAADGTGRNGLYTSVLLKHIATPGLRIEDVLKEVRKDVVAASADKQVPWESSSLTGDFYFSPSRGIAVKGRSATTPADPDPGVPRSKGDKEILFWQSIKDSDDPAVFATYLEQFPDGTFAGLAKVRISQLSQNQKVGSAAPTPTQSALPDNMGMTFVYLSPGAFRMGSPDSDPNRGQDEKQHSVTLTRGFYLQTTEVTVGQWRRFARETGYRTEAEKSGGCHEWSGSQWELREGSYWDRPGYPQSEDHPVACVSWNDAGAFIDWLNQKGTAVFRLPTEAEWEYATRAGSHTRYSFGDDALGLKDNAWHSGNSPTGARPVAQRRANRWGLHDMHGNLYEWCQDWYGPYPSAAVSDPIGPATGSERIFRGGSWGSHSWYLRSACRVRRAPSTRYNGVGFRLVREAHGTSSVPTGPVKTKAGQVARDGQFVAYDNEIVHDTTTDLEWMVGPDEDMTWYQAKAWVRDLVTDGGGWRMPTRSELEGLYQDREGLHNLSPIFKTTGRWVWSGEEKSATRAYAFSYYGGYAVNGDHSHSAYARAFAVRLRK